MAQRVLVVDDDPDLVDMLTDVLKALPRPLEVQSAGNGRSALEAIELETFDLVLLDVWMPVMDGIETLKAIKSMAPGLPVLMITGSDCASAAEALRLGAVGYLPKPMHLRYVEHIVSVALDRAGALAHA